MSEWFRPVAAEYVGENGDRGLFRLLLQCQALSEAAHEGLDRISNQGMASLLHESLRRVENVFTLQALLTPWDSVRSKWLTEASVRDLSMAAFALDDEPLSCENLLPEGTISSLIDEILGLIKSVGDADDLDEELREYLVHALSDILLAVSMYRATGARAIERATEVLAARLITHPDEARQVKKSSWGKRVLALVATLFYVTNFAADLSTAYSINAGDVPWHDAPVIQVVVKDLPPVVRGELESGQGAEDGASHEPTSTSTADPSASGEDAADG